MADVKIISQIQCDSCGKTENKFKGQFDKEYRKPSLWGSCRMEGGRTTDSYGGKGRLDFADLCPSCAEAAINAAADALVAERKSEVSA